MQGSHVKTKLQRGETSIGTFVFEFNTPGIARLAAEAGAEFVIYDMEHTGWSVESIRMLIASGRGTRAAPVVRVPATEYHFIARVLDCGATGVMVPMVESVGQAEQIVRFAKYPPDGRRGAAFTIAHDDYTAGDVAEKARAANEAGLLIAQIETVQGLEHVGEIAAVEGIDVLWIGQYDLTSSLGVAGRFDHPDYHAAVARVVAACRDHGKIPGMMSTSDDEGRWQLEQGFRMIACGGDLWIYQQALRDGIFVLRDLGGNE